VLRRRAVWEASDAWDLEDFLRKENFFKKNKGILAAAGIEHVTPRTEITNPGKWTTELAL